VGARLAAGVVVEPDRDVRRAPIVMLLIDDDWTIMERSVAGDLPSSGN
jgi:hypothetical protein